MGVGATQTRTAILVVLTLSWLLALTVAVNLACSVWPIGQEQGSTRLPRGF
jgi:hypothetical protein